MQHCPRRPATNWSCMVQLQTPIWMVLFRKLFENFHKGELHACIDSHRWRRNLILNTWPTEPSTENVIHCYYHNSYFTIFLLGFCHKYTVRSKEWELLPIMVFIPYCVICLPMNHDHGETWFHEALFSCFVTKTLKHSVPSTTVVCNITLFT